MQLNGFNLVDRYNQPSVDSPVAIRTFFINNGLYVDPYDVSACTIFSKLENANPLSIVDPITGLIKEDQALDTVLMNFGISGTDIESHDGMNGRVTFLNLGDYFPAYLPGNQASGIHRVGVGDYVAVLDGTLDGDLSGQYNMHAVFGEGPQVQNHASAIQDYIDVWTVKMTEASEYQIFITEFKLHNNTYINVAEPLILTTNNRLINKHVTLGSRVDLKITTDFTVQNKNIDPATLNLFKDYSINTVSVSVQKINDETTRLPARTPITFDEEENTPFVTDGINVTSDNTILYNFDTNLLSAITATAGVGGPSGTYIINAAYTILNQTFVTPPFYFEVI